MPGLLSFQSDEVVPASPISGLYKKGKTGVTEFLATLTTMQDVLEFEPRDFFANEDEVVPLGHFRFGVIETEREWESDFTMVFTLNEGLVTHWRPIFDYTAEAIAYQS